MAIAGASLTVVEDDESDKESVDKGSFSFLHAGGRVVEVCRVRKLWAAGLEPFGLRKDKKVFTVDLSRMTYSYTHMSDA